jgi:hypothetical protein
MLGFYPVSSAPISALVPPFVPQEAIIGGDDPFYKRPKGYKPQKPIWEKRKELDERLDAAIEAIYDKFDELPTPVQREVAEIVTHNKKKRDVALPPRAQINLERLASDLKAAERLMEIYLELRREEEMAIILMLAL